MSLAISSLGVPQLVDAKTPPTPVVSITGTELIDPASQEFTWPNVSVAVGMYVLQPSFSNQVILDSAAFFVADGCFGEATLSLSSTASASSSIPFTSSDVPKASRKNINGGAIAGGIVGALAIAAAAYFFCRRFVVVSSGTSPRAPRARGLVSGPRDSSHYSMQEQVDPFRDPVRSSYATMSTLESTASTFASTGAPTPSAAFPSGTSLEISNLPGWEPQYNLVDPECSAAHLAHGEGMI
ncbi:hypothetical protein FB45DRAFT_1024870 [Roridomyces roridus]|uniref:Uncharacterized protein n=1 Tax=Roridomyces roridus TaxID=1738132 RepID=A0AAD7C1Q1_9AGAR|nr:hypothetical protein FB45DRAFT_1024870 [Roridomyces roridus]